MGNKKEKNNILSYFAREFREYLVVYVILILVAMVATGTLVYYKKSTVAETTITLNYEEASKGLYPNSTRFSISLIKSDEVLERVIEKAGLKGITVEDIAENISAQGNHVHNLNEAKEGEYRIATSYDITYKKNPEIKSLSAQTMLDLIVQAYKEEFYEHYTYSNADLKCDLESMENLEYLEIADLFERESNKISRYLQEKIDENGTFQSENTQESFVSLKKLIDNFREVDLEKYRSFVKQSGLYKNKERYLDKLLYQNYLLDIKYQKFKEEFDIRMKAIDIYDSALTAVVLVPTVDTQREFYMSRTRVGVDYQAEAAERVNASANDVNKTINTNKTIIDKLENTFVISGSNAEKAKTMISTMTASLNDITEKTIITNREFVRYKTKDYLSAKTGERSLIEILGVKWMILAGGTTFVVICIWILFKGSRRKGEKRA